MLDTYSFYLITNKDHTQIYIGRTSKWVTKRWQQHLSSMRHNRAVTKPLQQCYNNAAPLLFQCIGLLQCDKSVAENIEAAFYDLYKGKDYTMLNAKRPTVKTKLSDIELKHYLALAQIGAIKYSTIYKYFAAEVYYNPTEYYKI